MTEFKFQNEYGTIQLNKKPCRVLSVVGLGLPEREFETVRYANSHGQETLSVTDQPRMISMSVDLLMKEGLGRELAKMTKILYRPGTLTVRSRGKTRVIPCRCTAWEEDARTPVLAKLVLQFTCDDPAFLAERGQKEGVFERINLITDPFSLPMVFSKRITEKDVINTGDLPVQPVLLLKCIQTGSEGIQITNNAPSGEKQFFALTTPMLTGEEIKVDFPNRRIESNMREGIIHFISDDTFLHSFVLEQGCNHINVTAGFGTDVSVICEFTPKFLEGFY